MRPPSFSSIRQRRPSPMRWLLLAFTIALCGAGAWLLTPREPPEAQPARAPRVRRGPAALEKPTRALTTRSVARVHVTASASAPLQRSTGDTEVSGHVIDAAGGPVPFAAVTARSLADSEPITISADADGAFRARLPAGALELLARAEAFSSALQQVEAPVSGVVLELGPSSVVVGQVVDADTHAPLAGVSVSVSPEPQQAIGDVPPREPPGSARTSPSGEFRIAGLRGGGSYRVVVTDTDWQSESSSVLLDVGTQSVPVLLEARPAALFTARILRDGEPCPEGSVRATGAREWTAPIAADGTARFLGLRPGHYLVDVFCAQALPHHVELEIEGAVVRELFVSSGLSVSGRVVDAEGRPLPRAKVAVRPRDPASPEPGALCSSDERGEFLCAGLAPGEHDCSVVDPLDAAAEVVPIALDSVSARDVVLEVRPLAGVRVLLRGDRQARAGARVLLRGPTAFPIEAELADDAFVFERLPLARYEVYVDQPSAEGAAAEIELTEAGQVLTLELTAPPRTVIAGRVVDESGEPLVDQWVSAMAADPLARSSRQTAPQALSDGKGAFTLAAVSGGIYDLAIDGSLGAARLYGIAAGADEVVLRVVPPTPSVADAL